MLFRLKQNDSKSLMPRKYLCGRILLTSLALCQATMPKTLGDDQELLAVIAKTGSQGGGSFAARVACDELAQRDVRFLPALLTAMDTSNPVAANWYRTIFEEIVSREFQNDRTQWPTAFLKTYVSDRRRAGRPRRLVMRLINRLEPDFQTSWLGGRLLDPEFRSEAVALTLKLGDEALVENDVNAATVQFRKAFEHARDRQQVLEAAKRLRSAGETADVVKQLGLVTDWWLTGPFDAPDRTGFELSFAPERGIDLQARYRGQSNRDFGWIRHQATDPLGQLNLVSTLGKAENAVAYAWTEITVDQAGDAQLRCGADDCCLVWLNDEVVSAHKQWLNGIRFDRFVNPVRLVEGRNRILVKVCQGPQHRNPEVSNYWSLQLRLCDHEGRGVPFESALPGRETESGPANQ